ncbi:MAG: prolipoprotein diacylglyceryl transferase [Oscillospiraceae bacterium]|nr:prolipoprotein diacylglyceryl transferase [Oscillospiraceae bacterium]
MYTEISFPSLGLTMNPPRSIEIGSFSIYYYGILIALGMALAVAYASRRSKEFGIKEDHLLDAVLWVTPFAILCARAYYCAFTWESYAANPISVLDIRSGGLAIYGGVIGAAVGVTVFCRRRKISLPALLDLCALGFLIGQSIGRWGNFFNREAFGAETASFLRMGLMSAYSGKVTYYHPTFLYESLWNAAGFLLLHKLSKKRKFDGQIALSYAAWYGLGRTFIEGLRTDSLYLGPFRVSQLLAAVSCIAAALVLVLQMRKKHDSEALYVNRVAAQKAAEAEEKEAETEETSEETAEEAEEATEETVEETENTEETSEE